MITTKQKWTLGGLICLSAGVWSPQLIERFGAETKAQVSMASGPDEAEMISIEEEVSGFPGDPMGGAMPPPVRSRSSAGGTSTSGAGDPDGGRSISSGGPDALLGEVLSVLSATEAFGVTEEASRAVQEREVEVEPEAPVPGETLRAYVKRHPLRGTIAGETISVALVGSHRLELGDYLPGTDARVIRIARGAITVADDEVTLDLVLDPLQTSQQQMLERSRAREQASTSGEPVPAASGATSDSTPPMTDAGEPFPGADAPVPGGN